MIKIKKNKILLIGFIFIVILTVIAYILNRSVKTIPSTNTIPIQTESTTSGVVQDTTADYQYGQTLIQLHQQYPWYSEIPIETKDYRIVYDFTKESFRIRLLITSSETIKQAAIKDLQNIGVDTTKFSYYFIEPQ
jgi:hypothetical protein